MLLRDYDFESRKHPTFTEDDIMNLFPIVKHTNPKVSIRGICFFLVFQQSKG